MDRSLTDDSSDENVSRARHLISKLIEVDKIISKVSSKGKVGTASQNDRPDVADTSVSETKQSTSRSRHAPPKNTSITSMSASVSLSKLSIDPSSGKKPVMSTLKKKSVTMAPLVDSADTLAGGFNKPQMSYCPKCYLELSLGSLRRHMAEECRNNEVACSEHDCNAVFPAEHLKMHLATECLAAKRRKKLVEVARLRKEKEAETIRLAHEAALVYVEAKKAPVKDEFIRDDMSFNSSSPIKPVQPPVEREISSGPCDACGNFIEFSVMPHHKLAECALRLVYCPNYHGGCAVQVPFRAISDHLKSQCLVEKFKNQLIARAAARCVLVKCIGCGTSCEVKHLAKHELQECVNRKVPCKNASKGCQVLVREKDRARHEEVDGVAKVRYTLYMSGDGSYVGVQEDDIQCPWTIEFWVYRISAREAVKQHLRNALEMIPQFYDAFSLEYAWKAQMDKYKELVGDRSLALQAREELMGILADIVEAFEDAAVISTRRGTELGCALMSARRAMTEFLGPNAELVREKADTQKGKELSRELMCLKRYPPGHEVPKEERLAPKPESRPSSRENSRPSSALQRTGSTADQQVPEWKPPTGSYGISALAVMLRLQIDPAAEATEKEHATNVTKFKLKKAELTRQEQQRSEVKDESDGVRSKEHMAQIELIEPLVAIPPPPALLLQSALKVDDRGEAGVGILTAAAQKTIMPWNDWYSLLEILTGLLEVDLENLHRLRILGGILKNDRPVDDDSSVASTETNSLASINTVEAERRAAEKIAKEAARREEEEIRKRKEKEKLRREMKRNKGKKELEGQLRAEADEAAELEVDTRTPEDIERQRLKDERERKRELREKLVPRLIDAAKAAAGRDVIMFSDNANRRGAHNKICLDMSYPGEYDDYLPAKKKDKKYKPPVWFDNQGGGECGIVCADTVLGGAERFSFGKAVPREKWVHIAFVANNEPNNRVTFVMDGMLVSQLKDCAFPLPMTCLAGATSLTGFSGCLLDTRIWTKPRSALEMKGTMNVLLNLEGSQEPLRADYDLTSKGLVAWWTFEEGPEEEDKLADVSEHRAPVLLQRSLSIESYDPDHESLVQMNATVQSILKLSQSTKYVFRPGTGSSASNLKVGRYWSCENAEECPLPWNPPLKPGEIRQLPVPAFSQTSLCQVELRQLAMAKKGRLLQRQINCTLGCEDFILKKDLRFHVQFLCTKRLMPCRYAPFCSERFLEADRDEHEEQTCVYLTKLRKLVTHNQQQKALKPCPLCSLPVRVRDKELHDKSQCLHRVIDCPHVDCEKKMQAHHLQDHLRFECESKVVTRRAMLVQRARERTHYPREWGLVVEYAIEEQSEDVHGQQVGEVILPSQDAAIGAPEGDAPVLNPKVVIIPEDFDRLAQDEVVPLQREVANEPTAAPEEVPKKPSSKANLRA